MKQIAKILLALVTALSLLGAPVGAGVVDASPAARKPAMHKKACCKDTSCPTRCCVERKQSPPAENLPVVPVSTFSHEFQVGMIPDLIRVLRTGSAPPESIARETAFAPRCSAVPLYVRTHSFLI